MKIKIKFDKLLLNRATYKNIKDYDYNQMNDFLIKHYINGYRSGLKDAELNYDAIKEVLLSIKGIGLYKADAVIATLKERSDTIKQKA